ncbi:hypothetical protein L6R53_25780 [Myxococcota bacterium]|nr:hypothetical protein [Myxococcota bacterium]
MIHDPHPAPMTSVGPCAAVAAARTQWFHRALPAGTPLHAMVRTEELHGHILVDWLAMAAGRYRAQVRIAASGRHAGVWLGLLALGATAREADSAGQRGRQELEQGLAELGWQVQPSEAPPLPRAWRCLDFGTTGPLGVGAPILPKVASSLERVARPGAPLVVVWTFDLSRARPAAVQQASPLRSQLYARITDPEPDDCPIERVRTLLECLMLLDAAIDATVTIQVHAHRLPGAVPMQMLANQLSLSHSQPATWARTLTPAPVQQVLIAAVLELLAVTPPPGPGKGDGR